jgi:protein-S-isoprenylcysteine O-methyltransferase Ste14
MSWQELVLRSIATSIFLFFSFCWLAYVWWVWISFKDCWTEMSKEEQKELVRKTISGEIYDEDN